MLTLTGDTPTPAIAEAKQVPPPAEPPTFSDGLSRGTEVASTIGSWLLALVGALVPFLPLLLVAGAAIGADLPAAWTAGTGPDHRGVTRRTGGLSVGGDQPTRSATTWSCPPPVWRRMCPSGPTGTTAKLFLVARWPPGSGWRPGADRRRPPRR